LKFIPLAKNFDIFKESQILLKQNRNRLFLESKEVQDRVRQRFDQSMIQKTDDLIVEMEEIYAKTYPSNFIPKDEFRLRAP
jgi:hypothetical protein